MSTLVTVCAPWVMLGFFVVWLTLGIIVLLRARPEDLVEVIRALARWGRK
jgi:hypothetical protein